MPIGFVCFMGVDPSYVIPFHGCSSTLSLQHDTSCLAPPVTNILLVYENYSGESSMRGVGVVVVMSQTTTAPCRNSTLPPCHHHTLPLRPHCKFTVALPFTLPSMLSLTTPPSLTTITGLPLSLGVCS